MQTLRQDVRYALKMLWKSRGVTVLAVISLAIGIGANSAIFSIVNSLLLRPRPVANPDQIVELYSGDTETPYHTLVTCRPGARRKSIRLWHSGIVKRRIA